MNENDFDYSYSKKDSEIVAKIKEKYEEKNIKKTKIEYLKELDRSTTKNANIIAYTIGIIGTLLFGVGMTCTMVWTDFFILGIVIGIIGIVLISINYPLYKSNVSKKRKEMAPIIFKLSEEIENNID